MATAAAARFPRIDKSLLIVTVLLVAVVAVGLLVSDRFGTGRNFMNVLEQSAALGFVALGQTLVVIAGGIDLSIGAMVTAAAVLVAGVVETRPELMVPMVAGVLAAGALVGAVNGLVTLKTGVHPLIVTLGTASILQGLVFLYTLRPAGGVPVWFEDFGYAAVGPVPVAGAVMLAMFVLVGLFLRYAPLGRAIYAVGGSPEAARLSGLRAGRVTVFVFAASGFFAALAGLYLVARTGVGDPRVGEPFTLASITPVIVGGTLLGGGRGGVWGTLLGVFLISLLNNLLNYMNVSTFLQWVVQGVIIIIAVSVYVNRRSRP